MIGETEESMELLNHELEKVNGLGNGMLIRQTQNSAMDIYAKRMTYYLFKVHTYFYN